MNSNSKNTKWKDSKIVGISYVKKGTSLKLKQISDQNAHLKLK